MCNYCLKQSPKYNAIHYVCFILENVKPGSSIVFPGNRKWHLARGNRVLVYCPLPYSTMAMTDVILLFTLALQDNTLSNNGVSETCLERCTNRNCWWKLLGHVFITMIVSQCLYMYLISLFSHLLCDSKHKSFNVPYYVYLSKLTIFSIILHPG